jgi:hypothetical protein
MEMIIGRIGSPADAKTVTVFIGHPRADRRVILHHMSVAVNYFVYFLCHGHAPGLL